ncbi:hypothetical protein GEMRC1_000309 [Eukaryota sp. GEM-RC1]
MALLLRYLLPAPPCPSINPSGSSNTVFHSLPCTLTSPFPLFPPQMLFKSSSQIAPVPLSPLSQGLLDASAAWLLSFTLKLTPSSTIGLLYAAPSRRLHHTLLEISSQCPTSANYSSLWAFLQGFSHSFLSSRFDVSETTASVLSGLSVSFLMHLPHGKNTAIQHALVSGGSMGVNSVVGDLINKIRK